MAKARSDDGEPVVIKKYANRRLYNTATSSYVTLDDLCDMVKNGVEFVVYDARSNDDITRSVLTQIIFEQEAKGHNLLPIGFLRQLIGYYDDGLHAVLPQYLEVTMETFARNREQTREQMESAFGGLFPAQHLQELGQQNMTMFRDALAMFTPFAQSAQSAQSAKSANGGGEAAAPRSPEVAKGPAEGMDDLKRQMTRMQEQLDALSGRAK